MCEHMQFRDNLCVQQCFPRTLIEKPLCLSIFFFSARHGDMSIKLPSLINQCLSQVFFCLFVCCNMQEIYALVRTYQVRFKFIIPGESKAEENVVVLNFSVSQNNNSVIKAFSSTVCLQSDEYSQKLMDRTSHQNTFQKTNCS